MNDTSVQNRIQNYASITKKNASNKFAQIIFTELLDTTCPIINSFSKWLLAGSGATIALMISNIEQIQKILTRTIYLQISINLIIISILFGILQMIMATKIFISIGTLKKVQEAFVTLFDKYIEDEEEIDSMAKEVGVTVDTEFDFNNIINETQKIAPWYIKKKDIQKGFEKHIADPLLIYRDNLKDLRKQSLLAILQIVFLLLFILVLILNLKS